MLMSLSRELQIEDPRNHAADVVRSLRNLLESGVTGRPDPKRPDFYEIVHESRVYYVHVSPITGKVLLLATWPKTASLEAAAGKVA
jgi:hypothetical protein